MYEGFRVSSGSDDSTNRPDLTAPVDVHFFSDHLIVERLGGKFRKGTQRAMRSGCRKTGVGRRPIEHGASKLHRMVERSIGTRGSLPPF